MEFLNSLDLPGLPPHKLEIAVGAVVILLRNIHSDLGLCNGVRAVVLDCKPRVLKISRADILAQMAAIVLLLKRAFKFFAKISSK